ncbi:MAG: 50S ribosomal protein L3 [Sedimentisphaerales bacterium]|nr:50S ribosomal protein L3 [Sedimentisphaerales bacterium]
MAMLLGKKVGMTRLYDQEGRSVPVTVLQVGPCVVTQVKTVATDGYDAVQLGYEDVKPSRQTKPLIGHFAKAGTGPKRFVREMRLAEDLSGQFKVGETLTVGVFEGTQRVDVISTSKGKGFQGVMKRHHFGGFPASHGTERKHRAQGSIASHATNRGFSGRPKKGKRMAGHMGNIRVTTKNHKVMLIDQERGLLVVSGTVPGSNGTYCVVKTAKTPVKVATK